jgi:hypothetical protein
MKKVSHQTRARHLLKMREQECPLSTALIGVMIHELVQSPAGCP